LADRRRTGVVGQRTLAVEAELPTTPVAPAEPPPEPSPPPPPRGPYAKVVSSSDALWERRVRWLHARERFEANQALPELEAEKSK
jgi:hypothetical protein